MPQVPNYHILQVSFIGPTNTKPSRVKITSRRFRESITIGYNHEFSTTLDIAEDWALKNDFNIIGHAEFGDSYLIMTDTFKSPKKKSKS